MELTAHHDRRAAAAKRLRSRRSWVGWLAVVAPFPYLCLKVAWVAGSQLGITEPGELAGSTYRAANVASIGADLIAVVVALALFQPFGRRLSGWLVLGPMWLATGFLGVILVLAPLSAPFAAASSTGRGLAGWVYVLVYGSFLIQGTALLGLFALYAAERWGPPSSVLGRPVSALVGGEASRAVAVLVVICCVALAAAYLAWASGVVHAGGELTVVDRLTLAVYAIVALVTASGLLALRRDDLTPEALWSGIALVWTGSAGMATWGCYYLALAAWRPDQAPASLVMAAVAKTGLALIALTFLRHATSQKRLR